MSLSAHDNQGFQTSHPKVTSTQTRCGVAPPAEVVYALLEFEAARSHDPLHHAAEVHGQTSVRPGVNWRSSSADSMKERTAF